MKDSFSIAELSAMQLSGELSEILSEFYPLDFIPHFSNRLVLASSDLPPQAVIDRLAAAWVYGAVARLTRKYFSAVPGGRVKAENYPHDSVTNRIIPAADTFTFRTLRMTDQQRTVIDLAYYAVSKTTSESEKIACYRAIPALVRGFRLDPSEIQKFSGLTPKNSDKKLARILLDSALDSPVDEILLAEVSDTRLSHFAFGTRHIPHQSA